jgi:hypothetical protein
MIDRRSILAGVGFGAVLAASSEHAAAGFRDPFASHLPLDPAWLKTQLAIPGGPPPTPADFSEPRAFAAYLVNRLLTRTRAVNITVENDARPPINELAGRGANAAFQSPQGELRQHGNFQALPVEIRRVIVLRNFDTFTDIAIFAATQRDRRLSAEIIGFVRGFLCPWYPFC